MEVFIQTKRTEECIRNQTCEFMGSSERCVLVASADGRIQVWNVSKSLLDPVVNISPRSPSAKDREYTKILFAHCSQIIVVGNDDGKVEVLELKQAETSPVEDLHRCLDNI